MAAPSRTKMHCPHCGEITVSFVRFSRYMEDKRELYRSRQCKTCGNRFTTREKISEVPRGRPKKKDERMVA